MSQPDRGGKNLELESLFKIHRNAVSEHLFPPMLRWFDLKSARIPASNRLARQKYLPQSGTPPDFKQALRVMQPFLIFLQRDLSLLTLLLFLPGPLAPGVERGGGDLPSLRPGEPLFVLPTVDLKDLVIFLALGPVDEGSDLLADAALRIGGDIAVLGGAPALDGEVEAAVFAHAHPLLPLDTFPEEVVDQVIDGIGVEDLCEGVGVNQLEFQRQGAEPKGFQRVGALPFIVTRHEILDRSLFPQINVQYLLKKPLDLPLHGVKIAGDVVQVLPGQQVDQIRAV